MLQSTNWYRWNLGQEGPVLFFGRYQQHNREYAMYTTTKPMITTNPLNDCFDYMNAVVFI